MTTTRAKRITPIVLCALLGTASVPCASAWAQGDFPDALTHLCTTDNVAGVFGFNEETVSSPGVREPRAFVGIVELQPNGTARLQKRGFRERGGEVREGQLLEGEWTVDDHCLGLIDFPESQAPGGNAVEFDLLFVAVANATELLLISNNPLEKMEAKLLFRR